jgi:hypothetical protein
VSRAAGHDDATEPPLDLYSARFSVACQPERSSKNIE